MDAPSGERPPPPAQRDEAAESELESGLESVVRRAVGARVGGRVTGLVVRVTAEGVTLDGCADCFHTKQLAQEAVRGLLNVRIAANRLRVRPTDGSRSDRPV